MAGKTKKKDTAKRKERDQALVRCWTDRWIPAGLEARERFMEDFEKVDSYLCGNHDALYENLRKFMNFEGMLCMTVNMAQQVRGYLGPHLYARNPVRTVTPTTDEPEKLALSKIVDAYVNATPEDTKLRKHMRKNVDESLLAGRGVTWTKKDDWTGMIATKHVPVRDVILDPDARDISEIQWVAIRVQEPLHVVRRKFGKKATEGLKTTVIGPSDKTAETRQDAGNYLTEELAAVAGKSTYICRYFVIYSKMGSGLAHGYHREKDHQGSDDGSRFKKIVVAPGFEKPLFEGDWDLSLYLDDDWPVGFTDFTPTLTGSKNGSKETRNGGLWPVSLMKLALPHQEAIDVLATRILNDLLLRSRAVFGLFGEAKEQMEKALKSGAANVVVKLGDEANGTNANEHLKRYDMGSVDPSFMALLQWNEDKFGEETGLLPVLKGGNGGNGQLRSAADVEMKDRNSRSRLEDMNSVVEDAAKDAARREGIAVRLDLEPEEVERVIRGKLELNKWKIRVIVGKRELRPSELRDGIWPAAGAYFDSQEQATQVAQDLRSKELPFSHGWAAMYPDEPYGGLQAIPTKVDVKEVWNDTAGITPREMALELSYRVEAGSARRPDQNKRIEESEKTVNTVGSILLQLQQYEEFNKALEIRYDAYQTPKANRVYVNAQSAQQFLQAQQRAQQEAQQAQQRQQSEDRQFDLQKIQATELAKGQREIATTAAKTAMDPVGSGGVR